MDLEDDGLGGGGGWILVGCRLSVSNPEVIWVKVNYLHVKYRP